MIPKKYTLLIVDDNPTNLKVLTAYFKEDDFRILVAQNGERAIQKALYIKPDIILLDVIMPDIDGFEVCRRLKAEESTQDIPIIFMTALSGLNDKIMGFSLGAVDYVVKPIQQEEVLARVNTHLRIRDLQQSLREQNITLQQEIAKHKQAEERLQQRNRELALLNQVGQMFSSTLELPQVLETILGEMCRLLDIVAASFWLCVPETGEVVCQQASGPSKDELTGWRLPLGQGIVGQAAQTGKTIIITDLQNNPHHYKGVDEKTGMEIRSILSIPFRSKNQVIGVLNLVDNKAGRFTQDDLNLVEPIAAAAARSVENAHLYLVAQQELIERKRVEEQLLKHTQRLETLAVLSEHLNAILDFDQLLYELVHQIRDRFDYYHVHIYLLDESKQDLVMRSGVGEAGIVMKERGHYIPLNAPTSLVARAARTCEIVAVGNVREESGWLANPLLPDTNAEMAVPIILKGKVVGVLDVQENLVDSLDEGDANLLRSLANQIAVALNNAHLFTEIQAVNKNLKTLNDRLQNELLLARQIQQSLLPVAYQHWPSLDLVSYSVPAHEVGGDFYAYHSVKQDNDAAQLSFFAVGVGDVSGKGMPAALLMAVSLGLFQSYVGQRLSPSQLLAYLDEAIVPYTRTTRQNCALCYLEIISPTFLPGAGILRVANAGGIIPIIKHGDGSVQWLDVSGMPLGIGMGAKAGYQQMSVNLLEGDVIIMTSDGLVEAKNSQNEMFGFERLELAVKSSLADSAESVLNHLKNQLATFVGTTEPHDDMTMVVIKV